MPSFRVHDRAPGLDGFELDVDLAAAEVRVDELIRGRVVAEIVRHGGKVARPLVEVTPEEAALNGARDPRTLGVERETRRALTAFQRGRFVLLVDGRQLARLEETVVLRPDSEVTFLRLVPLAGG